VIWYAISSFRTILWCFDHRWKLEFLIVRIITFLSCISFTVSQNLFV
jgi:hypothetical protein